MEMQKIDWIVVLIFSVVVLLVIYGEIDKPICGTDYTNHTIANYSWSGGYSGFVTGTVNNVWAIVLDNGENANLVTVYIPVSIGVVQCSSCTNLIHSYNLTRCLPVTYKR